MCASKTNDDRRNERNCFVVVKITQVVGMILVITKMPCHFHYRFSKEKKNIQTKQHLFGHLKSDTSIIAWTFF